MRVMMVIIVKAVIREREREKVVSGLTIIIITTSMLSTILGTPSKTDLKTRLYTQFQIEQAEIYSSQPEICSSHPEI